MRVKKHDYSGKRVFLGIDVHKKSYVIVAICDGVVAKKWTTTSDPHRLASEFQRFFEGAEIFSAYEAGFSGFSLHRILVKAGINNIVVNPGSIEVKANDRVKTDKRDARKIAEQLSVDKLKGIYVPSEPEEARRSLSRGREQTVKRRKAIGNQLKMKLHYLGYTIPEGLKASERFLQWVETLEMLAEHKFAVDELIDAWRQETKRIKRFNQALKDQASKDPIEEIYRSAPGIGTVSSRTLSNELGDMLRFDNERQLFSSSGLTPGEYSSGEHVRKGHITRQGAPRIRAILIEVAWRAIQEDKSLKDYYRRVAKNRGGKRAIVAVARKMLGRLRYCLKMKVKWQDLNQGKEAA